MESAWVIMQLEAVTGVTCIGAHHHAATDPVVHAVADSKQTVLHTQMLTACPTPARRQSVHRRPLVGRVVKAAHTFGEPSLCADTRWSVEAEPSGY